MSEVTQLKAKAYDILAALENLQMELQKVNAAIAEQLKQKNEVDASGNDHNHTS